MLSFLERRRKEGERFLLFTAKNGRSLHEELVTTFNGRHKVPIHIFTAEQLICATNNFTHPLKRVYDRRYGVYYMGLLEQRPISVKKLRNSRSIPSEDLIHDIVISSQMSHHKNVWKLMGCCLEFEYPALVYEYDVGFGFLDGLLDASNDDGRRKISLWTSRLRIANDIANAIVYLHMAFPTPIIYRFLNTSNVLVDQYGVAKLFDFSMSIALPPGELQVLDDVRGTIGYLDPEYLSTGFVSQKTDVYAFGMLLLVLLTGKNAYVESQLSENSGILLPDYIAGKELNEIVDPNITVLESGGIQQEQQLMSSLQLALNCIHSKSEDRPEMIDAARAIRQIRIKNNSRLTNSKVPVISSSTFVAPTRIVVDKIESWTLAEGR